MKKIILLSLCSLIVISASYSQKNYQPGFIVNEKGDTLRGLIEFKRWDRNPVKVSFKESTSSEPIAYQPFGIKSFSVADEYYESAIVDVDISPHKIGELDQSSMPVYVKDTVFLQSLFRGDKSLLHLKDKIGKTHFYILENGYQPLVYKQYIMAVYRFVNYEKRVSENFKYKGQLILYLKDCPNIQSKIEDTRYQTDALVKLFRNYHKCVNKSVEYVHDRKEGNMEFGIVVGASIAELQFADKTGFKYLSLERSVNPTLGFFYDLEILRANGVKISNDFLYTSFNIKGEGSGGGGGTVAYTTTASFNFHYLKTNHMVQINLLRNKSLYFSGGLSTGFVLKKDVDINVNYTTGLISAQEFQVRGYELGFVAGLGIRAGKWSAEARYDLTNGIGSYSNTRRLHFFIRYKLSRAMK